jgi:hypothetical protein
MKSKSILAVSFVLLMALSMSVSACIWCIGTDGWVGGVNKPAGLPIVLNGPSPAPGSGETWTYQWSVWSWDGSAYVGRPALASELSNGGRTLTITPGLTNCGKEFGALLTVTNTQGGDLCILKRCAWFNIICGDCPTILGFCQQQATSDNMPHGESGAPFTYSYTLNGNPWVPSVASLNLLAPGVYTWTATITPGGKVCPATGTNSFTVWAKPTGTISVS